jgi:hypothetical protein
MLRLKLAQRLGVLSYSGCNLGALPALIADADAALADVQVRVETVPGRRTARVS